jgi:O-acetylhomoserine (thiol)-lyase
MTNTKLHFDTQKIHAGYDSEKHNHAVSVPIYQTASFDLGSVDRAADLFSFTVPGFIYSRTENPTTDVLEKRVAALSGATSALLVGSGMAAISYSLLQIAEGGGRILAQPNIYGGTVDSFTKIYPAFGIEVDYPKDIHDPASYDAAIRKDTKAIFIESISNPNAELFDLQAIAEVAKKHDIPLIVDNTFATPYLLNPFDFGANIVVYSGTKALNGHGNAITGLILENDSFNFANGKYPQFTREEYLLSTRDGVAHSYIERFPGAAFTTRVRLTYVNYLGAKASPFDAYLLLLGIETLSERVAKQVETASKLVSYLEGKSQVLWVKHPSAKNSPYRGLAARYFPKGAGSIFTFGLAGDEKQRNEFINSIEVFSYHANVGDARSLIINSPKTTHGELTEQQQQLAGITEETIRISAGIEDVLDLIEDLEQAFAKVYL